MRTHLANAAYGMLDYLAYPMGMVAVAPIALRMLGVERFGVWTMAMAAISTGAIIASGFGDANTRAVAMAEARGDRAAVVAAVRTTLGIHIVLGVLMAALGWWLSPWMTGRLVGSHANLRLDCLWSLRMASLVMLVRAVETVCVSTQRAFARYGVAIGVSLGARIASLTAACILPFFVPSVSSIVITTVILTSVGTWIQFAQLKRVLGVPRLYPWCELSASRSLLSFGVFTWIQSVAGLLFGQVDRLIAGAAFGAAAVSAYTFCAQLSQPIYGLSAAGLHFLFPYLTSRDSLRDSYAIRRGVAIAFAANLFFVVCTLLGLLVFGSHILKIWAGEDIAREGARLLPIVASSTAVSALSVTGVYSMLALGRVRLVTLLSVLGGGAMLVSTPWLLPRFGLEGLGFARLLYGPFTLMIYMPLVASLARSVRPTVANVDPTACEEA